MKSWADSHPKAALMARKRAAILDAATAEFLRRGFDGTSMEAIAAASGVSIMTLYRHAEGKDDLFQAVIGRACHPSGDADLARREALARAPLRDALVAVGLMIQERFASPEATSLLRAVMVESARHPDLATMTYRALVIDREEELDAYLAGCSEARGLEAAERRSLSAAFISRLVGTDQLRVLLGMDGASEAERRARAEAAASELLGRLGVGP